VRRAPARQLDDLRRFRVRAPADTSLAPDIESIRRDLAGRRRATGGLDQAWDAIVPPDLRQSTRVERLTPGGVLTITAADSAALYEMDRWIRSGGLETLRAHCSVPLRRVKLQQ
jgi:hypothetical protein